MNKSQTTSLQDMDSHYDYLINKGIFRQPKDVKKDFKDRGIIQIESDWFKELSKDKQDDVLSQATKDWWNQYDNELNEESVKIKNNSFDGVDD